MVLQGAVSTVESQGKVIHLLVHHKERICLQKAHLMPQVTMHACCFRMRNKATCSQVTQKKQPLRVKKSSKGEIFSVRQTK